jgi:hypothetical protein
MAKGPQRDAGREALWRGVLARFGASGLSVRGFCARERVSEPSFYAWRRVIRERDAQRLRNGPAFVPVVVGDAPGAESHDGIVLELGAAPGRPVLTLRLPAALPVGQVAELASAILAAQAFERAATERRP